MCLEHTLQWCFLSRVDSVTLYVNVGNAFLKHRCFDLSCYDISTDYEVLVHMLYFGAILCGVCSSYFYFYLVIWSLSAPLIRSILPAIPGMNLLFPRLAYHRYVHPFLLKFLNRFHFDINYWNTETVLLKIHNGVPYSMDTGKVTTLTLLDLSAAIDHTILEKTWWLVRGYWEGTRVV